MTAPVDRAKQGRANRRKGADAERAVARWLRNNGFPGAERAVRAAYVGSDRVIPDPGDLTGTPGLVWQVKDCQVEHINVWLDDTDRQRRQAAADFGLLVLRRRGVGDVGSWWCWLYLDVLFHLGGTAHTWVGAARQIADEPVRLELGTVVELLRIRGYGEPGAFQ